MKRPSLWPAILGAAIWIFVAVQVTHGDDKPVKKKIPREDALTRASKCAAANDQIVKRLMAVPCGEGYLVFAEFNGATTGVFAAGQLPDDDCWYVLDKTASRDSGEFLASCWWH